MRIGLLWSCCVFYPVKRASVPTKHATYQIVLPIIYVHSFKGKFKAKVYFTLYAWDSV